MADSSFIWEPTKNVTKKDNGAARWSSLRINPWSDYSQQYRDQLLRWKTPYWDSIKKIPNRSNILIHCQTVKVFFSQNRLCKARSAWVWREKKNRPYFFSSVPSLTLRFYTHSSPETFDRCFLTLQKNTGCFAVQNLGSRGARTFLETLQLQDYECWSQNLTCCRRALVSFLTASSNSSLLQNNAWWGKAVKETK